MELNSNIGATTVNVSFDNPIAGDLYLAVLINNELWFITQNGAQISKSVVPFLSNASFSTPFKVLDINRDSTPPGIYTLFQVVTPVNATPLDANNWIGGSNGLSKLIITVNAQPQAKSGVTLYKDLSCAKCHDSDPALNKKGVLRGSFLEGLKASISKVIAMKYLQETSEEDLQTLSNYLKTFLWLPKLLPSPLTQKSNLNIM